MGTIAYQITSLTVVYTTVYSGADQTKHQSSASLAFVRGIHRGPVNSPIQMASNAENVSIPWRRHGKAITHIQNWSDFSLKITHASELIQVITILGCICYITLFENILYRTYFRYIYSTIIVYHSKRSEEFLETSSCSREIIGFLNK